MSVAEYDNLAEIYDEWSSADPAYLPTQCFYVEICQKFGGKIVELCVGTGRIAINLAKQGRSVTGVDISQSMLDLCKRRAEQEGVLDLIRLYNSDIISFEMQNRADLIILPFRSIGHVISLEDKRRLFTKIHENLVLGGRFIFDHYVFNEKWARDHDGIARLMRVIHMPDNRSKLVWDTYKYDFQSQFLECYIVIETIDIDGQLLNKRYNKLTFSWIDPNQVMSLAHDSGFDIEAIHGDFAYGPFTGTSDNQIWILRRQQ